VAEGLVIDVGM